MKHRQINVKERDLKLLASISPEQYIQFERIKKDNSAKVIQRAWRSKDDKLQEKVQQFANENSVSSFGVRKSVQRFAKHLKGLKNKNLTQSQESDKFKAKNATQLEEFVKASIETNSKLYPRSDDLPGKLTTKLCSKRKNNLVYMLVTSFVLLSRFYFG